MLKGRCEMLERSLMADLVKWKDSPHRKPLILRGVRQCGKTWLLKEFGKRSFKNIAYFNFERRGQIHTVFEKDLDPKRILMELAVLGGVKIEPRKTLIIFDEIQGSPEALNALKYFCEENPEYAIAAAGSLLGITLSSQKGFPVGKVDFLELYPCSFQEFLEAVDPKLLRYCQDQHKVAPLSGAFLAELEKHLRDYMVIGGMPEAVSAFLNSHDMAEVEKIQDGIITTYELDFSKHAPHADIPKLQLLWHSIPVQLGRENAKFMYGEVKSGARAKDLEDALRWLTEAGLISIVQRIEKPGIPLTAYADRKSFKIYLTDTGILRRLADVPASSILLNKDLFDEFKGRLVENFVLQQMKVMNYRSIYYWTSGNTAEVDFVIQHDSEIIPVEVKSGLNVKAKSLKTYRENYNPAKALRFSMQNLREDNGLLNIPLGLIYNTGIYLGK